MRMRNRRGLRGKRKYGLNEQDQAALEQQEIGEQALALLMGEEKMPQTGVDADENHVFKTVEQHVRGPLSTQDLTCAGGG